MVDWKKAEKDYTLEDWAKLHPFLGSFISTSHNYPSRREIMTASHIQLAWWSQYLPAPGRNFAQEHYGQGTPDPDGYAEARRTERDKKGLIFGRLMEFGGITPAIHALLTGDVPGAIQAQEVTDEKRRYNS